ncbi:MAG: EamA family transporter [Myxococcales bacterium]|nr:EamA family transporter [Myxococcales bacterium]
MPWVDGLLALVCWGFWAFFPKLASKHLPDAYSGVLFQYVGSIVCLLGYGAARGSLAPSYHPKGALFAVLGGVAATAGMAFYYRAAERSAVSVVAATTALYPIVSIALAMMLLGERLSPRQWAGAALALVAVALLVPTA